MLPGEIAYLIKKTHGEWNSHFSAFTKNDCSNSLSNTVRTVRVALLEWNTTAHTIKIVCAVVFSQQRAKVPGIQHCKVCSPDHLISSSEGDLGRLPCPCCWIVCSISFCRVVLTEAYLWFLSLRGHLFFLHWSALSTHNKGLFFFLEPAYLRLVLYTTLMTEQFSQHGPSSMLVVGAKPGLRGPGLCVQGICAAQPCLE